MKKKPIDMKKPEDYGVDVAPRLSIVKVVWGTRFRISVFDSGGRAKQRQFQLELDEAPKYLRDAPLFRGER